jgi:hypothetical protein
MFYQKLDFKPFVSYVLGDSSLYRGRNIQDTERVKYRFRSYEVAPLKAC